jgi:prepilin-type N-terminal cleavage/methylation domain-containing protein
MRWKAGRDARAFTLVELLIVLGVIGILASMLYPGIMRANNQAKNVLCVSQLHQVGVAATGIANDLNGRAPGHSNRAIERTLFHAVLQGMGSTRTFLCPADPARARSSEAGMDRTNTSYFISHSARLDEPQSILAGDRNVMAGPAGQPFALLNGSVTLSISNKFGWSLIMHHSKGNVLQGDGSAQLTTATALDRLIVAQPDPIISWYVPNAANDAASP